MSTPDGWRDVDIHDAVPGDAVPTLVRFLEAIAAGTAPNNHIGQDAAAALDRFKSGFEANGLDLRYFGYWIEHQYNQKQLPRIIEALKKKPKPKAVTVETLLGEEGVECLVRFIADLRAGTLLVEPGKMTVTLLKERVLERYKDRLAAAGLTDLDFLAVTMCRQFNIDPG